MRKLTLVKRSEPICPACNILQAQLEGENIPHDVIDISKSPELVEHLDITGVPVLIFEGTGGEEIRLTGLQPIERIQELLKEDL
jgi:predicted DsbA family dithiol-disulfide isomerase